MRIRVFRLISIALLGAHAWASCQAVSLSTESPQGAVRRGTHAWIERPWTIRYVITVTQDWPIAKQGAVMRNLKSKPGDSLELEEIFEPVAAIAIPNPPTPRSDRFSVVAIEFDKKGFVTTDHAHGRTLRGRLNRLQYITLSAGEGPTDPLYDLGHWFTGLGDISTHWAPGLCGLKDHPSPFSKTDTLYLYGPKFEISEFGPTFGCREWAYQLYDDERPYIDVTSYVRVGKTYPKHTYINDFIGWARFGDKKPVIGQHEGYWYCLHDCPGGDKPGAIADIKAWAAKQGWRAPRPPTKAPTFPDPPARQGNYPK